MIVWPHSVTGNSVTKTDQVLLVYTPEVAKARINFETRGLQIIRHSRRRGCILSGYRIVSA